MSILDSDIIDICENIQDILHMFSGKTILITGGQGFLGQYICATLNKLNQKYLIEPCEVIVVDNFITSSNKQQVKYDHFKYVKADITKIPIMDTPNYIIFLAGIASPHYYCKFPLETIEIVSKGLASYLSEVKAIGAKILFASSSEIYGEPDANNIPTKETYNGNVSTLSDRACYDESKRLGETLCRVYSQQGADVVIVRPFNFFGPLMQPTDYRVLPNFANSILNGIPVHLYGDGKQTRTFCYVSDGISGMLRVLLLGKSGEAYNIGNPDPEISMANVLALCEQIVDDVNIQYPSITKKIIANPTNYPVNGDPNRRCPDITKAKEHLGYIPKISLQKGLIKFLTWANEHYVS